MAHEAVGVYLNLSEIQTLLASIRATEARQKENGFPTTYFLREASKKLEDGRAYIINQMRNY